jgi:hypothetical protein
MHIHLADVVAPVVVATLFIVATSAFKAPQRRHFNAIMLAGAGAAYLNGGLGLWELAFTAVVTSCAYKGLNAYGFIGLDLLYAPLAIQLMYCPINSFQQSSSCTRPLPGGEKRTLNFSYFVARKI